MPENFSHSEFIHQIFLTFSYIFNYHKTSLQNQRLTDTAGLKFKSLLQCDKSVV